MLAEEAQLGRQMRLVALDVLKVASDLTFALAQRRRVSNQGPVRTGCSRERELVTAILLERTVPVDVVLTEGRHHHDAWRESEVDNLEAGNFEHEPAGRGVEGGVVRRLADITQALGGLVDAGEKERHE